MILSPGNGADRNRLTAPPKPIFQKWSEAWRVGSARGQPLGRRRPSLRLVACVIIGWRSRARPHFDVVGCSLDHKGSFPMRSNKVTALATCAVRRTALCGQKHMGARWIVVLWSGTSTDRAQPPRQWLTARRRGPLRELRASCVKFAREREPRAGCSRRFVWKNLQQPHGTSTARPFTSRRD